MTRVPRAAARPRAAEPPDAPFADLALVLSCEHATNAVPASLRARFAPHGELLASHRGWDPGALPVARALARALDAPLLTARVSRLVVDANRSEDRPGCFSEITRDLDPEAREALLARHHRPHRATVEAAVRAALAGRRRVLHLGVHSFTRTLDGRRRTTDVGLLFDPARPLEAELADAWRTALRRLAPDLAVHHNRPYRGTSDGLTTTLRGTLPATRYLGLELEICQDLVRPGDPGTARLAARVRDSLRVVLGR